MANFVLKRAAGGLRRRFEHSAVDVVFPAVIDAGKSAFLVAAVVERSAAVRAMLSQKPDSSLTVAKGDEIFTQEAHTLWRAVGLRNLFRQQGRNPISSHQCTHGCSGATLVMRSFSSRENISSPMFNGASRPDSGAN